VDNVEVIYVGVIGLVVWKWIAGRMDRVEERQMREELRRKRRRG
jgi:hypothetical protein